MIPTRSLYALALLLLLVQLPHTLHLPLWVSCLGGLLLGARLMMIRYPDLALLQRALSPVIVTSIAALSAVALHLDYGYFVGRDPSVAFLFVLVAAKFAEVRRSADATLLLCLSAFLLLTQYFYSQSIMAAAVTVPAVLALAYTLSILRDPDNSVNNTAQLRVITKLMLQGLPLAAVLFLVFPRLSGPLWSLPEDAMASTGLSDTMSPGSIGQLSQSDAVAFRVDFDTDPPPTQQRYWRGPVLTEFDGRRWWESTLNLESTRHYQGSAANLTSYTVMLQPHRQRWLFALDAAVGLPQRQHSSDSTNPQARPMHDTRSTDTTLGRFFSDGQIKANNTVTSVLRYTQTSILTDRTTPKHYPLNNTLFLPGKNQRTIEFANKLYKASSNDSDFAQNILRHFNQQAYFYTLSPQLLGDAPVDEFMFDTKSGFCEHYAAAFVVMMRAVGIPARVVTGYLGGEMNEGYMIVRQSDAHAWAEAFINNQWRRFDPTGAVAPARVEQGLAAALPNDDNVPSLSRLGTGWLKNAQLRWDALNHQWQRLVVGYDMDSQDSFWERLGLAKPALWQITLIIICIAAAWSAFILGIPTWSKRKLSAQEYYWKRFCRLLSTRGFTRYNLESQQEFIERISNHWPQQQERLGRLHANFSTLRFQANDQNHTNDRLSQIRRDMSFLRWRLYLHKNGTD